MSARTLLGGAGSHRTYPAGIIPILALTVLSLFLAPGSASSLTVADSGRWTPPQAWSSTAVHMALLPGYGSSHHSKVIWWLGTADHQSAYGGLWGWNQGEYNCTNYPASNFVDLGLPLPDSSKVFCSSESHLASGELFLAGGTQAENGRDTPTSSTRSPIYGGSSIR